MNIPEPLVLEPLLHEVAIKKRSLLPWWIKGFIWLFMLIASLIPIGIIAEWMGFSFQVSLYGLQSHTLFSPVGLLVSALFLFKGAVSFGLWTEKKWAIAAGIFDAIIGLMICVALILGLPVMQTGTGFQVRLEILFLIPYLLRLVKIRPAWEK